jgi:hypothetical protein
VKRGRKWREGRAHGLEDAWRLVRLKSREPHESWRVAILELVIELESLSNEALKAVSTSEGTDS